MGYHRIAFVHSISTSDLTRGLSKALESLEGLGLVAEKVAIEHPDIYRLAQRFDTASVRLRGLGNNLIRRYTAPSRNAPPALRAEYDFINATRGPVLSSVDPWGTWAAEVLDLPAFKTDLAQIFAGALVSLEAEKHIWAAVRPFLEIPTTPLGHLTLREGLLVFRAVHLETEVTQLRADLHGRPLEEVTQ